MRTFTRSSMVGAAMGLLAISGPAAAQYSGNRIAASSSASSGPTASRQIAVNRCSQEIQQQLTWGGKAYGNSGGRVLGIASIEPLSYGGSVTIRGVASSKSHLSSPQFAQTPVDLTWQCTADAQGLVTALRIQPVHGAYGASSSATTVSFDGDDYSRYGYHRY